MDQQEYAPLLAYVETGPDRRRARGKRHSWRVLWTIICAALASGQKTAWGIARWAIHRTERLCRVLKVKRIPSYSTIYRALRYVGRGALETRIAAYGQAVDEKDVQVGSIAAGDGERLRGQCADG